MNWLSFLHRRQAAADDTELLDRYRQCREAGRALNVTLAQQLPQSAVPECGKKLGIFKSGTLILNNDDEVAVLYDYCIYHYRRAGKNVVERYLERSPPPFESIEMELLQAMRNAYFSLFRVEDIHPHRGARLRDLITRHSLNLLDIGLSATGMPGIILAGRILPLTDFSMSSGAMIPVPAPVFDANILPVIQIYTKNQPADSPSRLGPGQEASFAARVLRIALHAGGEDNTFYSDIEH